MTRLRIALAAVIVTALLPAAFICVEVGTNPAVLRQRDDPLSAFERRLAPLREALRGERRVGYLPPDGVNRHTHLYSVRYALAPIQVIDDLNHPLVVADGVTAATRLPAPLQVRRDFGDGLLLLASPGR